MFQGISQMKASYARVAYAIAVVLVASYAFVTLRGPSGLRGLADKRAQIRELEKGNEDLTRQNERVRERIRRLNESPAENELMIKEWLKLVHPNEKVFVLGAPAAKTPAKN
jgi:cell division protein FtsB